LPRSRGTTIGYDPSADAFAQLESALAAAQAGDKLLLVIAGGDWCVRCHYLAAFLERERAIDAALHDVFVEQWRARGSQH
jgi:hypothetical protein